MDFSVIIVTYNRPQLLTRAVRSILDGSLLPNEIIVIDNACCVKTREAVEGLNCGDTKIRYFQECCKGISYARNKGVCEAEGDIIAFTDDDCVVDHMWAYHLVEAHRIFSDIPCIGGSTECLNNSAIGHACHMYREYITLANMASPDLEKTLFCQLKSEQYMFSLATHNLSFKKKSLKPMLFDVHMMAGEAVDLTLRLYACNNKSVYYLPNAVVRHQYLEGFVALVKKYAAYGYYGYVVDKQAGNNGYLPSMPRCKENYFFVIKYVKDFLKNSNLSWEKKTRSAMVFLFILKPVFDVFFILSKVTSGLRSRKCCL